jgi:hypothetical protein
MKWENNDDYCEIDGLKFLQINLLSHKTLYVYSLLS